MEARPRNTMNKLVRYSLLTAVAILTDWLVINHVDYASWTELYHWGFWITAWLLCLWIARNVLKSIALVVLLAVLEDAGFMAVYGVQNHIWPWNNSYTWLSVYGDWALPLGYMIPSGYLVGIILAAILWNMTRKKAEAR